MKNIDIDYDYYSTYDGRVGILSMVSLDVRLNITFGSMDKVGVVHHTQTVISAQVKMKVWAYCEKS